MVGAPKDKGSTLGTTLVMIVVIVGTPLAYYLSYFFLLIMVPLVIWLTWNEGIEKKRVEKQRLKKQREENGKTVSEIMSFRNYSVANEEWFTKMEEEHGLLKALKMMREHKDYGKSKGNRD